MLEKVKFKWELDVEDSIKVYYHKGTKRSHEMMTANKGFQNNLTELECASARFWYIIEKKNTNKAISSSLLKLVIHKQEVTFSLLPFWQEMMLQIRNHIVLKWTLMFRICARHVYWLLEYKCVIVLFA